MRSPNSRQLVRACFIVLTLLIALMVGYSVAFFAGGQRPVVFNAPTPARSQITAPTATRAPRPTAIAGIAEESTIAAPDAGGAQPLPITSTATTSPVLTRFVDDRFDAPDSGWLTRTTETSSAAYVDGQYRLTLNGQADIGFAQPLPDEYFRLSVDVAVEQGTAGLIFLAAEPATFYRFMITRTGQFSVQVQQQDRNITSPIIDWTQVEAIKQGPEQFNRLVVERRGAQVQCLVNDQLLAELTIQPGAFTSQYGLALTAQANTGAARFDNLLGERLPAEP